MNVEETIRTEKTIPLESRTIIHLMLVHNKLNEKLGRGFKTLRSFHTTV